MRDFLCSRKRGLWLFLAGAGLLLGVAWTQLEGDTGLKKSRETLRKQIYQWGVFERTLTTRNSYSDAEKYSAVWLEATFTGPGGQMYTVPGFWDGGNVWRIRFVPPQPGMWTYTVASSDGAMAGRDGRFTVITPPPALVERNPNYRGFLQVSDNGRYLTYADGTPFFWLGGTAWRANLSRMGFAAQPDDAGPNVAEFPHYVADRRRKGFTAVHIRAGYPTEPEAVNEGGPTFTRRYELINPANFQWLDKRIQHVAEQGMVPVITGQWYMGVADMPLADLQRYWKYLIARYQAYNVIWIVTGEYGFLDDLEKVEQLGAYVKRIDALDHVTAVHPTPNDPFFAYSSAEYFADAPWLDIHVQQTWDQAATRSAMVEDYGRTPVKPAINIEAGYDGLWGWNREMVRQDAWTTYMSGGAGYSYGANGIFNWNDGCCDEEEYSPPRWYDVLDAPSANDMRRLADFFAETAWWEMSPDDDLVSEGYTLVNPGEEYIVYLPPTAVGQAQFQNWPKPFVSRGESVTIDLSEAAGTFNAAWFNPRTGAWLAETAVAGGTEQTIPLPIERDAVLRLWRD